MTSATGSNDVSVSARPSWVAAWFHALFTKPGLEIDGYSHELHWGINNVDIPISTERIGVYFHYCG